MRGVIGSLIQSRFGKAIILFSTLAGIYLVVVSSSSDTGSEVQWRRARMYGGYANDQTLNVSERKTEATTTPESIRNSRQDRMKIWQNTTLAESANITVVSDSINFRTAFVITLAKGGIGLRLTALQECGSKRTTTVRIGDAQFKLNQTTVYAVCPWHFAPHCGLVGHFHTAEITKSAQQEVPLPDILPPFADIYDEMGDEWTQIELIDGSSSPTHKHKLAVCLQPMYLMADWPLIPNFFETWIGNGATIFYIYVHSISEEVDLILRMYEAQQDIEVIRVNWPAIPTNKSDVDELNPNNRMYRTEVLTAVNDCILRARATSDLVVSSDLDEIIAPLNANRNNETLLGIIDANRMVKRRGKVENLPGAFIFQHSFAYAENNWSSISHPSQLTFDHYKNVNYEKKVWPRGYRSKVVYVPDRVFRAHVHDVTAFEDRRWTTVVIDSKRARVLHFRQVKNKWMVPKKVTANSDVLRTAAAGWQASYDARIKAAKEMGTGSSSLIGAFTLAFNTQSWPNLGEQVLAEIESCRDENDEMKKDKCVTEWRCRSTMQSLRPGQWVEPNPSDAWTVI